MNVRSLFRDLRYRGQVKGDRRTYYAFESPSGYLLVSLNRQGGFNVNPVDREAVEVIAKRFRGQRVTRKILVTRARRPDLFGKGFAPLNALYVMAAIGSARKLVEREGRAMVFKIKTA